MVILMGVKKVFSNKKQKDFYMLQIATNGNPGEGMWVDNPFCNKSAYDQFRPEDSGKKIEIVWGSNDENPKYPAICGYNIIQEKGGK